MAIAHSLYIPFGSSGSTISGVVETFGDLPDPTTVPEEFYAVTQSQGTSWLPGTLGGTYYSKGIYYSDGITWTFMGSFPYQADQATLDAGTDNQSFVTPLTFTNASKWGNYSTTATANTLYFPLPGGTITGTAGTGFIGLIPQSSAPSTPVSGVKIYSRSTGAFSWKGTNGFERSFIGTGITADRTYTLPDLDGTVALTANNLSVFAATTSAQLAGVLSDEIGSGLVVFNNTPTLLTPTIAAINGGTSANDDITIQGTTNSTRTTSYVILQPSGGMVGINTTTPSAPLHVQATGVTSTREPVFRATVSDAGTDQLLIFNNTITDSRFAPAFGGIANSNSGVPAIGLVGFTTAGNDVGTTPLININATVTSSSTDPTNGTLSAVATRPLLRIGNSGTSLFEVLPNGNMGVATATPTLGKLQVQDGNIALIIGADVNANTLTSSIQKSARMGIPHYTNSEEPVAIFLGTSTVTDNTLHIGGGTSSMNAATVLRFYTASNNTTTTGTERVTINNAGRVGIGTTGSIMGVLDIRTPASTVAANFSDDNTYTLTIGPNGSVAGNGLITGTVGSGLSLGADNTNIMHFNPTTKNVGLGTSTPNSKLDITTSVGFGITTVTTNTTLSASHHTVLVDATSGNITITLPTATSSARRMYFIKKIDNSVNTVTIDGDGSELIDGATTKVLITQYDRVGIQSNATSWWIL